MFPCELLAKAPCPTLSIRFRAPSRDLPMHFTHAYAAILNYLHEIRCEHNGPAFAIYYNIDMDELDVEAGFPICVPLPGRGDIVASEIPGGTFAVYHYTGPYDAIAPAYGELAKYAEDNGYATTGIAIEWYLNGPNVPEEYLKTDIAYPVRRVGALAGV